MEQIVSTCYDTAAAAIVLVPLFCHLNRRHWHRWDQAAAYLLFALYLCSVYVAAGLPGFHNLTYRPRINSQFFLYMFSDYRSSLLNVLFFIPLGFLLPTIWSRFRPLWRTFLFALGASAFIELFQLLTPRATDVNDLVTNTAGALLGWGLARLLQWRIPSLRPVNNSRDVYWLSALSVGIMFLFYPLLIFLITSAW